jgi:ADP-ribose pyrophosphatase YjhB (NUDIX family)
MTGQINYNETVRVVGSLPDQYITGDVGELSPAFLPDAMYGQVVRSVPLICVDLFVVDPETGTVYLGKRQREPQSDWWIVGGRLFFGETFEQAAIRHGKRELGLDLTGNTFTQLGAVKNYVWATSNLGGACHTPDLTLLVELTPEQVKAIRHNDEYSETRWVSPVEILTAPDGQYHPAVVQMFEDYVATL